MKKEFHQLTRLGKIRRLRGVVAKALENYSLDVDRIVFLAIETNTRFKVTAFTGERYVLRIYSDEEIT
jgi:hypothetical protein